MRLLDCGCGPGAITIDLAKTIAPGKVVGVDIAENHLELATAAAKQKGISNIRFETANIYKFAVP